VTTASEATFHLGRLLILTCGGRARTRTAVGGLLAEAIPCYEKWFWGWRDLRNRVKEGLAASMVGMGRDVGASFTGVPVPKGQEGVVAYKTIFLGEVREALMKSSAVAEIAIERLRGTARQTT
jgi:hypothetical protein